MTGTGPVSDSEILSFGETWDIIRFGPFVIALVAILQNVSISKIYGSGQRVDGNQEMFALGVSKILGSLVSAQPVSASFSRSAVNDASGVRSPLGGLFTGCLILFCLGFLTSAFSYIPKASLAAVLICALLGMIEYDSLLPMWRISKWDLIVCCTTFVSSLILGMEYGIGIGVGMSLILLLYSEYFGTVLTPDLEIDPETGLKFIVLSPKNGLRFPGVDVVRKYVNKCALENSEIQVIVLDCLYWTSIDFSAVSAMASLITSLRKNGKYLVLLNGGAEWIPALKLAGVSDPELHHCSSNSKERETVPRFVRKSFPDQFVCSRESSLCNSVNSITNSVAGLVSTSKESESLSLPVATDRTV